MRRSSRTPAQVETLLPDALRALLALRERIEGLPEATAEALIDWQTRLILSDGRRMLSSPIALDSMLLRADYGVVPFHPQRAAVVDELVAWCERDATVSLRLLHGPGGTGKSRLLVEVADRLRRRGWQAGFLEPDADRAPAGTFARLLGGERPVCVAVDYAETRRETLVRLLRRARRGQAPRIRLVLLARAEAEWWRHLGREDRDARELMAGFAEARLLPPLPDDVPARRVVYDAAVAAFAARLGLRAPGIAAPALAGPHFATILFVHLAALAAVHGRRIEDADELIRDVVDRDRGAWELGLADLGLPRAQYRSAMAEAAVLATLAGGAGTEDRLKAVVARAPELAGAPAAVAGGIARLLARLYPDGASPGALRPDLLGEHLAEEQLSRSTVLLDAAFGERSDPTACRNGLVVLTRLATRKRARVDLLDRVLTRHLPHVAVAAVEVGVELGGLIVDREVEVLRAMSEDQRIEAARLLEPALPWPSVVTRELSLEVELALVDAERRAIVSTDEPGGAELARRLSNLGVRLSQLNRREEALAAAQEAVALRRALARARPDAFNPDLAASLSNLGNRLSALNRREDALAAEQEAVALRRVLAQARPDAFNPDLARSLSLLGDRLEEAGQLAAAIEADEEAVRRLAPLFETSPAGFGSLMAVIVRDYRLRAGAAGREADRGLLEPIEQALAGQAGAPAEPVDPGAPRSS